MSLRDAPLLAFARRDARPLSGHWANSSCDAGLPPVCPLNGADVIVTFQDATRHIGVIGQSGWGKTAGVMRPALDRLISSGCSGLVADAKSEYLYLAGDYPGRVVTIGAGSDSMPINIIGGMSVSVFREWLEQSRPRSQDQYWGSTAVDDAALVLMYQRACGGDAPTLASVVSALLAPSRFVHEFEGWLAHTKWLPTELADAIAAQQVNAFGILSLGGSALVPYDTRRSDSSRALEQYTWQVQHLLPGIRSAIADPRIRRGLCAGHTLDFHDLIYRQRKTLVVDLPESEFGAAADVLSRLLRTQFVSAILSYPSHQEEGYGHDRFTFFVADEYQHHIALSGAGAKRGIYDDSATFDRLRDFGHINMIATQSVSALRAQVSSAVPREAVDAMLQNVGTLIVFSTNDGETGKHLVQRVAPALVESVRGVASGGIRRGEAVVVSSYLARHESGLLGAVRTGGVSGANWMGLHIHRRPPRCPADRYARPAESFVANPHCRSIDALLEDARAAFEDASNRLLEDIRYAVCPRGIDPVVARTRIAVGKHSAGFALALDEDGPLDSRLLVEGLGIAPEGGEIGLPLAALKRLAADVPESMLATGSDFRALEDRVEQHPLALERSIMYTSLFSFQWDGVGEFTVDEGAWRVLASAAEHYYQLLIEAVKARSAAGEEIFEDILL